jgi:hypothetical protein
MLMVENGEWIFLMWHTLCSSYSLLGMVGGIISVIWDPYTKTRPGDTVVLANYLAVK